MQGISQIVVISPLPNRIPTEKTMDIKNSGATCGISQGKSTYIDHALAYASIQQSLSGIKYVTNMLQICLPYEVSLLLKKFSAFWNQPLFLTTCVLCAQIWFHLSWCVPVSTECCNNETFTPRVTCSSQALPKPAHDFSSGVVCVGYARKNWLQHM